MKLKSNSLAIRFAVALLLLFLVNAAYADYVVGQKFTVTNGMMYKTTNGSTGYYAMKFEVINVKPNGYYEVKIYSDTSLSQPGSGSDYYVREIEIPQFVVYNGTSFTITNVGYLRAPSSTIKKVILPPTIEVIDQYAFRTFGVLTEVTGADNLRIIGEQAFYQCYRLASLPDVADFAYVEEIGDYAFIRCDSLRTANLARIRKLGVGSFTGKAEPDYVPYRTEGLTSLVLGNQLEDSIPENCFLNQYRLTSVEIPSGVEKIGKKAFYGCEGLTSVILHDGLKIIEENAFGSCRGITSIELPASVNSIGKSALSYNINTITVHATTPPTLGTQSFSKTPTVYVPTGCRSLYLTADEWKKYKIEEFQIPATGISLNPQTVNFTSVGQTATLTATIMPSDATNKDVTWTSSNPSVATVSNIGVVTAAANGTAVITATTCDGTNLTATCMVYVTIKEAQTLELASLPAMNYGNAAYTLPATTVQGQTLTWTSSNTSVATVSGNTLTIKGTGTATITASQAGNSQYLPFSKEYTLTVAKAALIITADNKTKQQGEANPELTVSYNGFAYDDDASVLTTQPTITTTATTDSPAGTYPITVSGAAAANYDITYVNGTLTVTEGPVVIEVTDISQLDNAIYIEPVEVISGSQAVLSVKMKNNVDVQTIQFDLYLPDGITIIANEDDELITASKERVRKFNYFESSIQANGALRLLAQATTTNVPAGDGEICTINVNIPEDMEEGDYPLVFKDMLMIERDNTSHSPSPNIVKTKLTVFSYVPGDANNDGTINGIDFNMIGNYILGYNQNNFNARAADINGDGSVNAIDFNIVGNIILYGNSSPSKAKKTSKAIEPA